MIKYTHSENEKMLRVIEVQALEAGLLKSDERLRYEKGSSGTATVIRLQKLGDTWKNQIRPTWVPEFGYKDGPSFVGNVLVAVSNMLYGINALEQTKVQEENQRKMRYLSEHVARRSGREDLQ